jgi:hypothetical protein
LTLLVGGAAGSVTLAFSGLGDLGGSAAVEGSLTHATGTDGVEPKPDGFIQGTLPIAAGGTATLRFDLPRDTDAALVTLSPTAAAPAGVTVTPPSTQRFEAESGKIVGGRKFTIRPQAFAANRASGDAYVGFFNKTGAALTLPVSVPAAGTYVLSLAYSNGQGRPQSVALAANGRPPQRLELLPTQGRELFGRATATLDLAAGASILTITRLDPPLHLPVGPSVLELDDVDLTPAP